MTPEEFNNALRRNNIEYEGPHSNSGLIEKLFNEIWPIELGTDYKVAPKPARDIVNNHRQPLLNAERSLKRKGIFLDNSTIAAENYDEEPL